MTELNIVTAAATEVREPNVLGRMARMTEALVECLGLDPQVAANGNVVMGETVEHLPRFVNYCFSFVYARNGMNYRHMVNASSDGNDNLLFLSISYAPFTAVAQAVPMPVTA